jgi:hypothetical protein
MKNPDKTIWLWWLIIFGCCALLACCTTSRYPLCAENLYDSSCELVGDPPIYSLNSQGDTLSVQHIHCNTHSVCIEVYKKYGTAVRGKTTKYHKYD